ncbi:hypothetical protein ACXYFN_03090 [Mycoplasma sp. 48589B]
MFKNLKKLLFIPTILVPISLPMVSLACTPQQQYIDAVNSLNAMANDYQNRVNSGEKEWTYLAISLRNATAFYNKGNELADEAGGHYSAKNYFKLVAQIEGIEQFASSVADNIKKEPRWYNARIYKMIDAYRIIYTNNIEIGSSLSSLDNIRKTFNQIWSNDPDDSKLLFNNIQDDYKVYKNLLTQIQSLYNLIQPNSYISAHPEAISKFTAFKEELSKLLAKNDKDWTLVDVIPELLQSTNKILKESNEELKALLSNEEFLNSLDEGQKAQVNNFNKAFLPQLPVNELQSHLQYVLSDALNNVWQKIYLEILFTFYETYKFDSIIPASTSNNINKKLTEANKLYRTLYAELEQYELDAEDTTEENSHSNEISPELIKNVKEYNVIPAQEYSEISDKIKEYLTKNKKN